MKSFFRYFKRNPFGGFAFLQYICSRDITLLSEQLKIEVMMQTKQMILEEIRRLFDDLDKATYGDYKANGHVIPPNANRFYYTVIRLYEQADMLDKNYSPDYVSPFDYKCIYNSQRIILLHLNVLKDSKKLKGQELTWELEKYLMKLYGMFGFVST